MKIMIYKDGLPAGEQEIPDDIMAKAYEVSRYMERHQIESLFGIGPVLNLNCKISALTAEIDRYKALLELADALRNHEKGM